MAGKGLVGRKMGMTQIFRADGTVVPVTVLEAGPCVVTDIRRPERDGYRAVQLGFGAQKATRLTKPELGHLARHDLSPPRLLRELDLSALPDLRIGQTVGAEIFAVGERVDVTGITKGRGFQGGIKRHHWRGGGATHGSMFHRAPGSIGASAFPSRVFKGKRLPGHMGAERVTVQNLEIVDVRENILLVRGAVPGATNGYVMIRSTVKRRPDAAVVRA